PSDPDYRPLSNEISEIEPELINALGKLVRLGDLNNDGAFASRTIPLSRESVQLFEQFRQFLHSEKDNLDGREREWWAKGPTQVLRIGGPLAFLSWAWSECEPEPSQVDAKFIEAAIAIWRDYFWPHSRAALRQIGVNRNHSHRRRALRWLIKNKKEDVS